jgi:probable HAF family extracellular repeat protein
MEDLGTLGGEWSIASAVNDRGEIVGSAATSEGLGHAFRWDPRTGRMSDLGVLPGKIVSHANDINNRGEIVGSSSSAGDNTSSAFLWHPRNRGHASRHHPRGTMVPLVGIDGSSDALGVNDRGYVVGTRVTADEQLRAFLWSPHTRVAVDLVGVDGDEAAADDVNNRLTVAGTARGAHGNGQFVAVIWKPERFLATAPPRVLAGWSCPTGPL